MLQLVTAVIKPHKLDEVKDALKGIGVHGITVNTVHGSDPTIAAIRQRYDPDVESMEGAAFMYASLIAGVPFAQVRSVSNAVERRNRGAWKLDQAIEALGAESLRLLESL